MKITENKNGTYTVQSDSGSTYLIQSNGHEWKCNCPAGQHGRTCKHIREHAKIWESDDPADADHGYNDMSHEIAAACRGKRAYREYCGY